MSRIVRMDFAGNITVSRGTKANGGSRRCRVSDQDDLMRIAARLALLEEAHRQWDKESLCKLIAERDLLREQLATAQQRVEQARFP